MDATSFAHSFPLGDGAALYADPKTHHLLQYLTRCLVTAGMGLPLYSPFSRGFSLT